MFEQCNPAASSNLDFRQEAIGGLHVSYQARNRKLKYVSKKFVSAIDVLCVLTRVSLKHSRFCFKQ